MIGHLVARSRHRQREESLLAFETFLREQNERIEALSVDFDRRRRERAAGFVRVDSDIQEVEIKK